MCGVVEVTRFGASLVCEKGCLTRFQEMGAYSGAPLRLECGHAPKYSIALNAIKRQLLKTTEFCSKRPYFSISSQRGYDNLRILLLMHF